MTIDGRDIPNRIVLIDRRVTRRIDDRDQPSQFVIHILNGCLSHARSRREDGEEQQEDSPSMRRAHADLHGPETLKVGIVRASCTAHKAKRLTIRAIA